MRLALSGFLFEDGYARQSVPLDVFCHIARSAGYDGVELRETQVGLASSGDRRREVLQTVSDAGLSVTCLTCRGLPPNGAERDDHFRRSLALCVNLGCALLKIGAEPAWLTRAAAEAAECGVALATNNHIGSRLETVAGTHAYLAEVGHPNMGLLYDSLHLMVTGEDYIGCVPALAPVTRNILVHSLREARPGEAAMIERDGRRWAQARMTEPDIQDWAAVFGAFRASGYDDLITVIESGWPEPEREDVARECASVIRRLWEGC